MLKKRLKRIHLYHLLGLTLGIYILGNVILDYEKLWIGTELGAKFNRAAFVTGSAVTGQDFLRIFDWQSFSDQPRMRFMSTILFIINAKFRVWLWQFVPPHPTFSLIWVFNLLSLIFLFKFVVNFTKNRKAAWTALLLYGCSTGFLSNFTLMLHPAKPVATFCIIFSLFAMSVLSKRTEAKGKLEGKELFPYAGLLIFQFFSFFLDEMAIVAIGLVPIFFPSFFIRPSNRGLIWVLHLSPFYLFLIMITYVLPDISTQLGYGENNFWKSAIASNPSIIHGYFRPINLFKNVHFQLKDHFFHFGPRWLKAIGSITLAGILLYLYLKEKSHRIFLKKGMVATLAFIAAFTLLHTRHIYTPPNSYYYGIPFSLLWSITLGIWIAPKATMKPGYGHATLLIAFMIMFLAKFEINAKFQTSLVATKKSVKKDFKTHPHFVPHYIDAFTDYETYSHSKIKNVWNAHRKGEDLNPHLSRLPPHAMSLVWEIVHTRMPG